MNKKLMILLVIIGFVLVLAGCNKGNDNKEAPALQKSEQTENKQETSENSDKPLNPRDLERYNSEGAVQMGVIFANPLGQEKKGYLTFVVQMDNHSYNLNEYDLSKYARLVDDKGNSPQGKAEWEVYSGGGHHVINHLLFPDNGFITADTKYVKLVIKDFIDLPLREFVWEKEFLGIKE
ncbi:MAG: hypothetical protein ACOWWO_15400 [Peptococcaceae bacterium]